MTVAYEDAMQIIEDPKAAAWELRDLAKSLLEDLQAAKAAERERLAERADHDYGLGNLTAKYIRMLGDKP